MKDKKTLEFKTRAFEVRVFWNGPLMSLQLAVVIGALAMLLFTDSEAVRSLIKTGLLVDAIALLFYMITEASPSKDEVSTESVTEHAEVTKEELDVEVKHERSKKDDKAIVKEVKGTINKRVPIPNPNGKPKADNDGFMEPDLEADKNIVSEDTLKNDFTDFF